MEINERKMYEFIKLNEFNSYREGNRIIKTEKFVQLSQDLFENDEEYFFYEKEFRKRLWVEYLFMDDVKKHVWSGKFKNYNPNGTRKI